MKRAMLLALIAIASAAFAQDESEKALEAKLLGYMNQMRSSSGIAPLSGDSRLAEGARFHLVEFARRRQVSDQYEGEPNLLERLTLVQVPSGAAGEIMFIIPDVNRPVDDLFRSENVRQAVLNPKFTVIGFAITRVGEQTFVVANLVQPLTMLSIEELELRLVQALQKLRSTRGVIPFKTPEMRRLRGVACDMGKKDSLKAGPSIDPYASYIGAPSSTYRNITYTTADPGQLPGGLQDIAGDPKLNAVSVGACFAKTPTFPGGTYWVALLFYSVR